MSTNYYLYGHDSDAERDNPQWHIGKRYAAGDGKTGFMWAMHPTEGFVQAVDLLHLMGLRPIAVDESGQVYMFAAFVNLINACDEYDESHIGEWFS